MTSDGTPPPFGDVRPSPGIANLFAPGVVAMELRGRADTRALAPEEARECRGFAPKRVADFAAGRLCARRALEVLGYGGFALGVAEDRRPRWPIGVVGSISHTANFCAAVVVTSRNFESIGLDAERLATIDEELWPTLFTPEETAWLRSLGLDRERAATIIFSAKEAYYKCHFGMTPTWLDFTDVVVTLPQSNAESGAFTVHAASGSERRAAPRAGRYMTCEDVIITGVAHARIGTT
jgi:4'-phosphopantetheinyl transferase EntD